MRAEVRRLLRDEVSANYYWDDQVLLDLANQAIDLRVMDLTEAHEGWVKDAFTADVVANQSLYSLPEGTGKVERVLWVEENGRVKTPILRDERFSEPVSNLNQATGVATIPSARLVGELLVLEPPPAKNVTGGLEIEISYAPPRLVDGTSKLPLRFPDVMETLIVYDTATLALAVEAAQGNFDAQRAEKLERTRRDYEARFLEFIQVRLESRVFGKGFYLGD